MTTHNPGRSHFHRFAAITNISMRIIGSSLTPETADSFTPQD